MLLNIQIFFLSLPLAIAFAMIPSPTSIAPKRGAFIVLEGVDRCGKTTQCGLLLKHLLSLGLSANAIRFPDRTTSVGTLINSYLQSSQNLDDRAIHLLFSANRWEAVPTLKENLAAGTTLICDRYAHSGVAFSSAKESDLTVDWCKGPDIGLPSPDAVIFLNLSQDEAEQRGGYVLRYVTLRSLRCIVYGCGDFVFQRTIFLTLLLYSTATAGNVTKSVICSCASGSASTSSKKRTTEKFHGT